MVGPAQTDKAHRILEEWDEALADQEELNSALQAPAEALEEVEVEALEAELEDLLMAEKAVSAERNDERESLELDLAKLSIKDPETVGEQSGEKVQDVSGLAPQNATAEVKVAELV